MVICFTVDAGAKIALDNLVKSGLYQDVSEAICVSLINHDIIQREAQHNGGLEITRADLLDDRSAFVRGSGTVPVRPQAAPVPPANSVSRVPEIFHLPRTSISPDEFRLIADDIDERPITSPKQWLFGQYNKLLPLKATVRALLNLTGPQRNGVPIAEAIRTISTEAWVLGDYLDSLDQQNGSKREDALATAFPTTSGSGSLGQSRFGNQFVVSVNADEIATGLPIAFRVVAYIGGKTPRLSLSRQGVQFALLENPVFDLASTDGPSKFSAAEVSFLVNHILKYVPQERSAFESVLGALSQGVQTPKDMDNFLADNFADNTMTMAFLSLQRSGVISRLVDLELVRRVRDGTRVKYVTTESGVEVLGQLSTAKTPASHQR